MKENISKNDKDHKKKNEEKGKEQGDCISVLSPEMARNYEENEPCNDGTKSKREKK